MKIKLSLQIRIFIIICIFAVLALLVVWALLRPKYEGSMNAERMKTIRHLQSYVVEDIDHTIANWTHITQFIASEVTERPKEGGLVLRSMVALHPEIIQIKIRSPKLSDELTSQNILYARPNMEIKDSVWVRSKTDSMLQIAWMNDSSSRQNIFATQKQFKIQNIPFVITVVWEAKKLNAVFAELPLGEGYFASIQSATSVLMQNTSSFKARELTGAQESAMTEQTVRQNESNWKVLIGAFQTVQLWIVIAVPEKTVLKPLEDFLLYSTISIIGTAFVMLCLGWMLSFQIKRPIAHLVKDVQRLSKFDFTQTIQIPAMKDLRGMAEAIELLRQALERNKPLLTKSNNAGSYVTGENSILPNSSPLQTSPRLIEFLNPPEPKTIQWHPSIILTAPEVNRSESYNVSYEWRKGPTLIGYGKTIEAPLNAGKNVYLLKALDQDDVGVQPAEVEIVINCE